MNNSLKAAIGISVFALASCQQGMKEFKKLPSGLEYKIIKDVKGDKKAIEGSMVSFHIVTKVNDSTVMDSRKMNQDKPIETKVNAPSNIPGDIMEAFPYLSEGDSVVMRISSDSLFKGEQANSRPPFVPQGAMVYFNVKLEKVQTKEEFDKAKNDLSKKQFDIEDKALTEFMSKNNIQATKTASGMYYVITSPGSGANAANGQMVKMKYTGKLLNGNTFDSNEDPKFNHTEPFEFVLGQGMVIPGWDEGIALLNKGAKAKFLIPSPLAYGEQARPGSPANADGIPANSTLIFDVEVLDIKDAPKQ
ncbi:MAG: FKBP-type peptidyl-prolyl cis-trans isomerase [Chitinophagaceae bacterium]